MEGDPAWDWNPKWKQRCQKREISSGSVAVKNPTIRGVFSVQQLLSTPAAVWCLQNVHTQLLLGRQGKSWPAMNVPLRHCGESAGCPAVPSSLTVWSLAVMFLPLVLVLQLFCFAISCVAVKAALACADSVIKYDPSHIMPTVHYALSKTLSSLHFFSFTCFSEMSVSFPWWQWVQQIEGWALGFRNSFLLE